MAGPDDVAITIPKLKVFVTGGTGYIGGSVLTALLRSPDLSVTTLVRSEPAIETLTSPTTNPKFFAGSIPECVLGSLSDLELLKKHASKSDIVVNCASANDLAAAEALIEGLAESAEGAKKIFIQTSGTSAFAVYQDGALAGDPVSDTDNLIKLMREMNEKEEYGHRTVALKVIELGKEKNVKTFIIVPPTIYGAGAALIPRLSVQLPPLIRTAIESKKARYIGSGTAIWSNVHVTDLANLYDLIIRSALSDSAAYGEEGIYFVSNGEKSWRGIAEHIRDAVEGLEGWDGGNISLEAWDAEDAGKIPGVNGVRDAKLAFGSNVRTIPNRSLSLGWKPAFGDEALQESIKKDASILWEEIKGKSE